MARRVSDWMRLQTGDLVVDLDDERHEGRVDAIRSSYWVTVVWSETGWRSEVPLHRLRRTWTPPTSVLHRTKAPA